VIDLGLFDPAWLLGTGVLLGSILGFLLGSILMGISTGAILFSMDDTK
jgi:hypothetical protein